MRKKKKIKLLRLALIDATLTMSRFARNHRAKVASLTDPDKIKETISKARDNESRVVHYKEVLKKTK